MNQWLRDIVLPMFHKNKWFLFYREVPQKVKLWKSHGAQLLTSINIWCPKEAWWEFNLHVSKILHHLKSNFSLCWWLFWSSSMIKRMGGTCGYLLREMISTPYVKAAVSFEEEHCACLLILTQWPVISFCLTSDVSSQLASQLSFPNTIPEAVGHL